MTLYPLCGIIPPHILKAIHLHGDLQEKAFANHTLLLSEKIRTGRREILTPAQPVTIQKQRAIYDTKNSEILPGKLVRKELSPSVKDITVNESYDASGATYDLFKDIYLRNSIDGKGLTIVSTVHYSHKYDNAFWNGEQMVYGDGDGDLFGRFTKCIDITGHELTHGVVQYEANFAYQNQSGALHESYADIFGSLVKQRSLKQTADKADWLIGQGLFTSKVKGAALRSLKAPGTAYNDPVLGKDPQPSTMKGFVKTTEDNGGVHINSGIPNHAFYLAATEIGGFAYEKTGTIWYEALVSTLNNTASFADCAKATWKMAGKLYGINGKEQKIVKNAWNKVGITI